MDAWRTRSPSPLPFKDPVIDGDDGHWDWYYGNPGGGTELNFGKYRGQRINQISWSYLQYCRETFDKRRNNQRFFEAFDIYRHGLELLAHDQYDKFVVPFGKKYRGKEIRQCRDKPWLLWTMGQTKLREKYPIFFLAVRNWLDNPRKYEATRDIGQLLSVTEYEDDLNLHQDDYHEEEEPTTSDDDFIVPDPEDDEIDMDMLCERMSQDEETDSGDESEAVATTESEISDMHPNQHDNEQSQAVSTNDHLPLSRHTRSNVRLQQPVQKRHTAQLKPPSQDNDADQESEAVFTDTEMTTDGQDEDTYDPEAVSTGAEESTENEPSDAAISAASICASYKRRKRIHSLDQYVTEMSHMAPAKPFQSQAREKRETRPIIPQGPLPASSQRVRKKAYVDSESSSGSDGERSTCRKSPSKAVQLQEHVKRETNEISLRTPLPSPRRIFRRKPFVVPESNTSSSSVGNRSSNPSQPHAGGKRKLNERSPPTPPPTRRRTVKRAYIESEPESNNELPYLRKECSVSRLYKRNPRSSERAK